MLKGLLRDWFHKCDKNLQIVALIKATTGFPSFSEAPQIFKWHTSSSRLMLKARRDSLRYPINFCQWTGGSLIVTDILSASSKAELGFPNLFEVLPLLLRHCNSLSNCYCISVNTTWRTASLIQNFIEHAEPTQTFFNLIQIFRIIRRKRQAALLVVVALFNYILHYN